MKNIFKEGPLDKCVITTDILTNGDGFVNTLPVEEYNGEEPPYQLIDGTWARNWYYTGIGSEHYEETIEPEPKKDPPKKTASAGVSSDDRVQPTSDLRARREALNVTRTPISQMTGLTVGVVARVEMKGGTPEEIDLFEKALEQLESRG